MYLVLHFNYLKQTKNGCLLENPVRSWLLEMLPGVQWISPPCAAFTYTLVARCLYSRLDQVKTEGLRGRQTICQEGRDFPFLPGVQWQCTEPPSGAAWRRTLVGPWYGRASVAGLPSSAGAPFSAFQSFLWHHHADTFSSLRHAGQILVAATRRNAWSSLVQIWGLVGEDCSAALCTSVCNTVLHTKPTMSKLLQNVTAV